MTPGPSGPSSRHRTKQPEIDIAHTHLAQIRDEERVAQTLSSLHAHLALLCGRPAPRGLQGTGASRSEPLDRVSTKRLRPAPAEKSRRSLRSPMNPTYRRSLIR